LPPAETLTQTDAPVVEALLVAAKQAAEDQRLVLPEDDNARERYREILIIEPENREALRGLRSISDVFVERAGTALRSGNPQAAVSALTIASETDAGNPAIGMVTELLIAQGDAQLTAARMAAATGDIEQATSALGRAAQYAHIDPATISAVREQLTGLAFEVALLDGLAVVDNHVAAGRLLEPSGNNALESLAALSDEYGSDPRLTAAYERLAERLLTRAAFATAAGSVAEAEFLIDAADSLGVLEAEVDLARESIATTAVTAGPETETVIADEARDFSNSSAVDSEMLVDANNDLDALAPPTQSGSDLASGGDEVTSAASGGSAAMSLEDLGLERFIAPTYPRRAQRRGLTGYVEVAFDITPDGRTDAIEVLGGTPAEIFDKSAADAVRKWRFAPRQDTIRGNVTLRFEIAE
jgi:TonB family protein